MSKSAAPSNTHRALGWNCDIVCAKNNIFGGYYQHLDLLTVADVVHDLDLCFSPPGHGDDGGDGSQWRRALIPETESRDANGLVLHLDEQDNTTKIPTPDPGSRTRYRYVLHERACTRHREKHSLQDSCLRLAPQPRRRRDPRYLQIGKSDTSDPKLALIAPRRGDVARKRIRTGSGSLSRSPSNSPSPERSPSPYKDGQDEAQEAVIPTAIIDSQTGKEYINNFRSDVISINSPAQCVVTGKGGYWCTGSPVGPGIQAAHIVPATHWSRFPLDDQQGIADTNNPENLKDAWYGTYDPANGLLMASHLHQCFDQRLFSIHPDTGIIRVFLPYSLLLEYHGKHAHLAPGVSKRALRFHYDMCCIENFGAKIPLPPSPVPLSIRSDAATKLPVNTSKPIPGDPNKTQNQSTAAARMPAATPAPKDTQHGAADTGADPPASDSDDAAGSEELDSTKLPPSPPSSCRMSKQDDPQRQFRLWRVGELILSDFRKAEWYQNQGWLVVNIDGEDEDKQQEESCVGQTSYTEDCNLVENLNRGRLRKRKRLTPDEF
ncbi:hypothetical protein MGG_10925 [Pyricularia oryzae 70-15]|uniref:HNH nuclease domain-containing protein n=1 Tax=Pyricularia oryzae (strain 70-15 / ATCC MYA-4617 / FGSC 8958) TaxID=242507 RepID=G4MLW0_PYRO7|nr:uncharacterized protein MGG_10925 [Pyricularia oryzae 70-15]EHA58527.1 hypothetical protein MGG_10925 [Pyricularia oryzae 70-15]KAI7909279.1 hypothetical protein M9X92_011727 [Pyricularia oryzae]